MATINDMAEANLAALAREMLGDYLNYRKVVPSGYGGLHDHATISVGEAPHTLDYDIDDLDEYRTECGDHMLEALDNFCQTHDVDQYTMHDAIEDGRLTGGWG